MEIHIQIWKDIEGFEGFYQISSYGNLRSVERKVKHWRGGMLTKKAKSIQPCKTRCGYLLCSISKLGVKNRALIHRLVAVAFIKNPQNKEQVNHINGIKTDNRVQNLEWNTRSENIQHADKNNLRILKGSNNGGAKLNESDVLQIRAFGNSKTTKEIADLYNVKTSCITRIIQRKRWSHI